MAVWPIRYLPDPVLRQRTKRVQTLDSPLQTLLDDMVDSMRAARGVGLAANQIGVSLRVAVIEIPEEGLVRFLVNPQMVSRSGERELEEGCLSIPGYRGSVKRSQRVVVRALDRNGKPIRIVAEDNLLAQALEHELGHLNGQLYIDHLVSKDAIWKIPERETEPAEAPAGAQ
ncbi:MAG: peptide deformylase [Chloroflexi bacterium]|nr:peptide deformylase [Chloroflexota bacterium]